MKRQTWNFLFAIMFLLSSSSSFAQAEKTVKRHVATVLFSSLGGAILGLSTLSFYGEPQEHTNNISVGALLGFVAGVSYVAYDSSRSVNTKPVDDYSKLFDADQNSRRAFAANTTKAPLLVNYQFDF